MRWSKNNTYREDNDRAFKEQEPLRRNQQRKCLKEFQVGESERDQKTGKEASKKPGKQPWFTALPV